MSFAYMDHASATPVRKQVVEAMLPYFQDNFGNPSTVYDLGQQIREVINEHRLKAANLIGAEGEEIIFTSSGAEANNLAVKGAALAWRKKGNHIVISAIEHHSVINSARYLERMGYETAFAPTDERGVVKTDHLLKQIRPETVLVSTMHANNEIGTIQPISEIAAICEEKNVIFHTDAVASVGNIPVNVKKLGVDLLSFSGASIGAPKGIGGLYFKNQIRLMPLIHGGIQEGGRRAGTENVPGIVGLGKAAELAGFELPEKESYIRHLRDALKEGLCEHVDKIRITGHPTNRLPGHLSCCVEAVEGESLTIALSQEGIYANTGSACASKALKVSPVLTAIGVPPEIAQGSVVFTLNHNNTMEEVEYVLEKFPKIVDKLRAFSPLWKAKDKTLNKQHGMGL